MRRTIIACALTALAVGTGTATAAKLITSNDIAPGAVQTRNIHNDAVTLNRLSPGVRGLLAQAGKPGANGLNGKDGAQGPKGDTGAKGDKGGTGANGDQGATGATGATGDTGAQGPAGKDAYNVVQVNTLSTDGNVVPPGWAKRGTGASLADGHVKFGPFANGSDFGGVRYRGLDGLRLNQLEALSYEQMVDTGDKNAAPYFIVQTDQGRVIYSPSTQPGDTQSAGQWQVEKVLDGGVRFEDDAGNTPDESWATLLGGHGGAVIQYIQVQAGNAGAQSAGTTSYADHVKVAVKGQSQVPDTLFDFGG
jgi:hypothetical protein